MIQAALNGMIAIMLARFMLNDVPHALGITVQDREQVAASHWKQILQYCHTVDDLKKIANRQGIIRVYHGAPTEFAELMVKEGPQVPYKVEDIARHVAKVYGLRWIELAPYAYRKHEVREKLSTATAPIAARWAWSFPLGEVLTDLNAHARLVVAALELARGKGIKLRDAMDELYDKATELASTRGERFTFEGSADILGLPDKFALQSKTGALVELTIDASALPDYVTHDANYYLEEIKTGELPVEEALLFWNHNYMDMRIDPSSIRSARIVVRDMPPWEQDMIEEMIKEKQLSPYCGVSANPDTEKYRLVKRTKLGSLVEIQHEGDKAKIEISNMEDIQDISNLLNATGIKWDISSGISKSAWEGMPAWRRIKRGPMSERAGTYPGQTITFDYADLEKVMEGRILPWLKLGEAE